MIASSTRRKRREASTEKPIPVVGEAKKEKRKNSVNARFFRLSHDRDNVTQMLRRYCLCRMAMQEHRRLQEGASTKGRSEAPAPDHTGPMRRVGGFVAQAGALANSWGFTKHMANRSQDHV